MGAAIADGLQEAHQHGILHRDLKPGNVVLSEGGLPKILDFGIARLIGGDGGAAPLTITGLILGSLPYMAPEQLMGEADDARTDIYALGVMLFEMATGRRPVRQDPSRSADVRDLQQRRTAPALTPPRRAGRVRAAGGRLSETRSRSSALNPPRFVGTGAPGDRQRHADGHRMPLAARDVIRAIAVLPLRNASNDPSQEYFADGMTEAIISDLTMIRGLRVISRTSAMRYKGSTKSLPEIARELNVDAVLEGSALLAGTRVRVSVQLVAARTDRTLWSARYDRELRGRARPPE